MVIEVEIIPIRNWINPIPPIDTYFFTIISNTFQYLRLDFAEDYFLYLSFKILKVSLPSSILATCLVHINCLDLITLT